MAKYIIIEDFESQYFNSSNGKTELVIFPKDNVIEALISPVDGSLVTTPKGEKPIFEITGQNLVKVVETKVKQIADDSDKIAKEKNLMKWVYLGGAAVLLWWFIYGREDKKKPQ